jgi:hypothetical protein
MSLPAWMTSQLAAATATNGPTDAAWSVHITSDNGLTETVRTDNKTYADTWLATSGQTGTVTANPGRSNP